VVRPHGRHGQRNVDRRAVLALPNGFEVLDREAGANASHDFGLSVEAVLGNDDRDRLADDFVGGIPENPLGAAVPGLDDAVEILTDDRVVRRGHDGGEPQRFTLETIGLVLRSRWHPRISIPTARHTERLMGPTGPWKLRRAQALTGSERVGMASGSQIAGLSRFFWRHTILARVANTGLQDPC